MHLLLTWLSFVGICLCADVAVDLRANWTSAHFAVQLVEAASFDPALYEKTVRSLFTESDDWDDEDELEEDDLDDSCDQSHYKKLSSALSETQVGLLNLNLVNQIYSPRVQAHYEHYTNDIAPSLEAKVLKTCSKDSFGETISDPLAVWVKYGSKLYCSEQDLYALQTDKSSESLLPFDRVLGHNEAAPIVVLYGAPSSERFRGMFAALVQFADAGNLRFVWRYPADKSGSPVQLTGYGKTLTTKLEPKLKKAESKLGTVRKFLEKHSNSKSYAVSPEDLPSLAAKLTSFILSESKKRQLSVLSELVYQLPKYAAHLVDATPHENLDEVKASALRNEKLGASSDMVGVSINGAMVHRLDTDLPYVINKLQKEAELIQEMAELGFSTRQSKQMLSKFALLSAYKEAEFKKGSFKNRYALYKEEFDVEDSSSGGVVFFNNIERDTQYDFLSSQRDDIYALNSRHFRQGQIPPLRENVHDLVFVINPSDKNQLKVFFAMSKTILDKGIPQQLGVLPLISSEKDVMIADMFYHILEVGESTEALAFLYKYYESEAGKESEVFDLITMPEDAKGKFPNYNATLSRYSIDVPSVIINGVIHNMRSKTWQSQMGQQIVRDVKFLQNAVHHGVDSHDSLKSLLFAEAKSERNTRIVPKDPANVRYKTVSQEMIANSISLRKSVSSKKYSTFWLIGDFTSNVILEQLKELLNYMRVSSDQSLQIRLLDISNRTPLMDDIASRYGGKNLDSPAIKKLVNEIGDVRVQVVPGRNVSTIALLERNNIQVHQPAMLFNSRYIRLMDKPFDVRDFQLLSEYEFPQRLDTFDEVTSAYPEIFDHKSVIDFKPSEADAFDWSDLMASTITNSFFVEDSVVRTDVARFDFSSLNFDNAIDVVPYDSSRDVDILVVIDPLDAFSQKLLALTESLIDLSFVNIRILLQPFTTYENVPLNRLFQSGFVPSKPEFSAEGDYVPYQTKDFSNVVPGTYVAELDSPSRWHIVRGESTENADADRLVIENTDVQVGFTLSKISVETSVRNVATGSGIHGIVLEAKKGDLRHEGFTMQNLGYNQMLLEPGCWEVSLKPNTASSANFDLLSISENRYVANDEALNSVPLLIDSLSGNTLHARIRQHISSEPLSPFGESESANEVINVFSIARGQTYEELLAMMMMTVKEHTKHTVKFWLLEEFMSAKFVDSLPSFAEEYGFQYELVRYQWPIWLRAQTELQRKVWAYKILFLDVLFPENVDRVIFVDADQIARADLQELMKLDLEGAPYAFTPMCESKKEMEGYQFWKQGYWQNVLKDDLKYHISALFVVDLHTFRKYAVGDRLREHYQKLSSDPNSLSNLDQDLPNNLQRAIPIYSLPQDWLWCDTWCSAESMQTAKMIDLCSDPTSSEDKISRARRIIPEWESYHKKLTNIGLKKSDQVIDHDEL